MGREEGKRGEGRNCNTRRGLLCFERHGKRTRRYVLIEPVQTARGEGRRGREGGGGGRGEICSIPGMYLVHLCAISCVFGLVAFAGDYGDLEYILAGRRI